MIILGCSNRGARNAANATAAAVAQMMATRPSRPKRAVVLICGITAFAYAFASVAHATENRDRR